jgi:aromatic ring-opening dioxygenase catalytic subunit (LigB family)
MDWTWGPADTWLKTQRFLEGLFATLPAPERSALLTGWRKAPFAVYAHPREEHLIPLLVAAGAGGDAPGERIFGDEPMGAAVYIGDARTPTWLAQFLGDPHATARRLEDGRFERGCRGPE